MWRDGRRVEANDAKSVVTCMTRFPRPLGPAVPANGLLGQHCISGREALALLVVALFTSYALWSPRPRPLHGARLWACSHDFAYSIHSFAALPRICAAPVRPVSSLVLLLVFVSSYFPPHSSLPYPSAHLPPRWLAFILRPRIVLMIVSAP